MVGTDSRRILPCRESSIKSFPAKGVMDQLFLFWLTDVSGCKRLTTSCRVMGESEILSFRPSSQTPEQDSMFSLHTRLAAIYH